MNPAAARSGERTCTVIALPSTVPTAGWRSRPGRCAGCRSRRSRSRSRGSMPRRAGGAGQRTPGTPVSGDARCQAQTTQEAGGHGTGGCGPCGGQGGPRGRDQSDCQGRGDGDQPASRRGGQPEVRRTPGPRRRRSPRRARRGEDGGQDAPTTSRPQPGPGRSRSHGVGLGRWRRRRRGRRARRRRTISARAARPVDAGDQSGGDALTTRTAGGSACGAVGAGGDGHALLAGGGSHRDVHVEPGPLGDGLGGGPHAFAVEVADPGDAAT